MANLTIDNFKEQMITKAKRKGGIWEDFGQKEINQLKDKYGYDPYKWEKRPIVEKIDGLDEWAMNFDLSQLK
jgi:hypothetical protein